MARIFRSALLLGLGLLLPAQSTPPSAFPNALPATADPAAPATRLVKEIQAARQHVLNLRELSDTFGPRLTGSENLRHAQHWLMDKLKAYGAVDVHEEAYELGLPWSRGVEWARLIGPNGRWIPLNQMGWTRSISTPTQGDLVAVPIRTPEEGVAWKGKLKGKIILRTPLEDVRPAPGDGEQTKKDAARLQAWFMEEGVLALLQMSSKKDGLVLMRGGEGRHAETPQPPTAIVPAETYRSLFRLVEKGPQCMELCLGGTLGSKPVQAFNVVASLPGTDKADELVILGGHFDSWDLATGTMDNGTGAMMTLEVLRALNACGLKPRRTLRLVFWTGEEQGLIGSRAHVAAHAGELPRVQAMLTQDSGCGGMKGLTLFGREDLRPVMASVLASVHDLGIKDLPVGNRRQSYSDHAPYGWAGVPAFFAIVDRVDYGVTYHSTTDTFDHLQPDAWTHAVQGMAVITWELLNLEARLPHVPPIELK